MIDPKLKASVIARLGKVHDSVLAREIGASPSIVGKWRKQRGLAKPPKKAFPWGRIVPLLGKVPDCEIAVRFDIAEITVRRHRGLRRIPGYDRKVNSRYYGVVGTTWDIDIARAFGVTKSTVIMQRRKWGIPSHIEKKTCVCGKTFVTNRPQYRFCSPRCCRLFHRVHLVDLAVETGGLNGGKTSRYDGSVTRAAKLELGEIMYALGRLSLAIKHQQKGV